MTNRDWFCLALRLFGIWLLIQSVETIVPYLIFAVSTNGFGQNLSYVFFMIFWQIGRTAIGLALLFFAPAIAARCYRDKVSKEIALLDDEANPLRVGIQLLALYALLLAVQSGAGVILGLLSGDIPGLTMGMDFSGAESYFASLLTFGLNLAFAAILLMWNERVVTLIAKFRYIPERDAYEPSPPSD